MVQPSQRSHPKLFWNPRAKNTGEPVGSLGFRTVILRIPRVGGRGHNGAMGKNCRVVLADDHQDVLEEIRYLLAPEFDVVGSVKEGLALIQAVFELRPDAVISDIKMPRLNGIDAGRQILEKGLCKAVIALTTYNEPLFVDSAIQAGIRGYVLKIEASEELVPAVRTVVGGGIYLSQRVRRQAGWASAR